MSKKGAVHIEGLEELSGFLNQLPKEVREQILAVAVDRAARPVVKRAKSFAQRSVRTGALQESLGHVVRKYKRKGTAVAVVGPRKGWFEGRKVLGKGDDKSRGTMPSKYAHLVEFGHATAAGTGRSLKAGKGKNTREGTFEASAFVLGQPFLRPALAAARNEVRNELLLGIADGLKKFRQRAGKAGTHRA